MPGKVDTAELLKLWRGDDLSLGYAHPAIVIEYLRLTGDSLKGTQARLVTASDDPTVAAIVDEGYRLWHELGRPRRSIESSRRREGRSK